MEEEPEEIVLRPTVKYVAFECNDDSIDPASFYFMQRFPYLGGESDDAEPEDD